MTARHTDPHRDLADAADNGANYVSVFVRLDFLRERIRAVRVWFRSRPDYGRETPIGLFIDGLAGLSSFLVARDGLVDERTAFVLGRTARFVRRVMARSVILLCFIRECVIVIIIIICIILAMRSTWTLL